MFARIKTVSFEGIEAVSTDVEVHFSSGLPGLSIVGLATKSVMEAKDRVRSAIMLMGHGTPAKRVTVNLSPADLQKDGNHYDLAIAVGILVCMEVLTPEEVEGVLFIGELSLDGRLNYVNGALPAGVYAARGGLRMVVPPESYREIMSMLNTGIILAAESLAELVDILKKKKHFVPPSQLEDFADKKQPLDYKDVRGQKHAKIAMEIAAAGGHNLLMIGRPGSGKSMLAARFPTILPPLGLEEKMEVSVIKSIAGLLKRGEITSLRPFRAPHTSASMAAMIGGGRTIKPGEITLAHNGVLFLDEFAEFPPFVLDALRQPMETREVHIARVERHITYPSNFQLIAAMNPCKCGYMGDAKKECARVPLCGEAYIKKISGPILERIDMHVFVNPYFESKFIKSSESNDEETSAEILERVTAARKIQARRYGTERVLNAHADEPKVSTVVAEILEKASSKFSLSMRECGKIIRVARTIADLESASEISTRHAIEALQYRSVIKLSA